VAGRSGLQVERVGDAMMRPDGGCELLEHLTPDAAIIAYNVYHARRIAAAGQMLGLSPGYHYGLICCDDSAEATAHWPGLSRVSFDRYDLGIQAAQMLLNTLQRGNTSRTNDTPSRLLSGRWLPGCSAWGPRDCSSLIPKC
jgi:DNA-binding LacI/PurR family transcriptional regulator